MHDFGVGIELDVQADLTLSAIVDGVAFYGCQQAVTLLSASGSGAIDLDVTIQRCLARSPDGSTTLTPTEHLFEFSPESDPSGFTERHNLKIQFLGGDYRTKALALQASVIYAMLPRRTNIDLTVDGVTIAGRPAGALPPLPPPIPIGRSGIEVIAPFAEHQVDVRLANSKVRDAQMDGVYVEIAGDLVAESNSFGTFVAENGCVISDNGADVSLDRAHTASGIRLVATEAGTWSTVRVSNSQVNNNYRHGLFAEGSSYPDQPDDFGSVVLGKSEFRFNGQSPSGQAHGVFFKVKDYDVTFLSMHHLYLSNNWTSGFRLAGQATGGSRDRLYQIRASNCVLSENQGRNAVGLHMYDAAPFVLYGDGNCSAVVQLAQLTITDNDAPYAIAVQYGSQDPDALTGTNTDLWSPGSNVHNCVLNKNGPVTVPALGTSDQAFYPWPSQAGPSNLWQLVFGSTYASSLGRLGAPDPTAYANLRQNQYVDPALTVVTGASDLGLVFPDLAQGSPVIDAGLGTTVPDTSNDVRGEPRPDTQTGLKDMGAYEVQQ